MVLVKVCGVTNIEDALAAVEAGADELGFNFWRGSKRFVAPRVAREIVESLPRAVGCVGVFVDEEAGALARAAEESGVGAVQLHGEETPDYCAGLSGLRVIKALRVGPGFTAGGAVVYRTDSLLLDAYAEGAQGGTGKTFDWTVARAARGLVARLYLAGGLSAANVAAAIRAVGPYAVDVCSGVESSPGRKDRKLLRDFVREARAAENS